MSAISTRPRERAAPRRPAPRVRPPWWRSRGLKGIGYTTPTALIVIVLFLAPLALVFWMSLNRWPLLGSPTVNAPDNYTRIRDNPLFVDSVWFTLKYTVLVTIMLLVIAFGLALLVQERRPGVGFFRTTYLLPSGVGFAAAALLFYGLYSSEIGPLDGILRGIGLIDEPIAWTGTPSTALFSTIALVIWRFAGFQMLILLTGLQSIPLELYEAARVDGASRWQAFRRITVPLMRPTLALLLVLSITGSLLAFDQFFILTQGQPDNSTITMVMVIYREAFFRFNLGSAAALSVVVLIVLVALNGLQLRILRRDRTESEPS
jgi:multiple sugar transport system permease protein